MEGRVVANLCAIFEEAPQLNATDKSGEEICQTQLREVEYHRVDEPGEGDADDDDGHLAYGVPRAATLEAPRLVKTFGAVVRGDNSRKEIDRNEGYGATNKPDDRREDADDGRKEAEDQFEKGVFHSRLRVRSFCLLSRKDAHGGRGAIEWAGSPPCAEITGFV